jgi:protein-S-isoprenylcysteine O-methyltransferase Ste14
MDQKTFSIAAGGIFAVVALFHLVRIYMGWPVMIGDWSVPMWLSWIGLIIAGGLAFFGMSFATRDTR